MSWVDNMVNEYKEGRKTLMGLKNNLDETDLHQLDEKRVITRMIKDMDFTIEWLTKGRDPTSLKGIDKSSVYQRTALLEDMNIFPSLLEEYKETRAVSQEIKAKIVEALLLMSARQRECYMMYHVQLLSFSEIANLLGVTKSTVQVNIKRAREKMNDVLSAAEVI